MELHVFAAGLPKCELHAHLAGSVPEPVVRGWLGADEPWSAFRDFAEFLSRYGRVEQLLDTPDRVREALRGMVDTWARDHTAWEEPNSSVVHVSRSPTAPLQLL